MSGEDLFAKVIGRTLRMHREIRGMSLSTMAKQLGFASASGWSRVETGVTVMTVGQLYAASKVLGVEPHDVVKAAMGMMFNPQETE